MNYLAVINEECLVRAGQLKNRYLYDGKELTNDFGLNWYDYQLRRYDPTTGRWMSPDVLADEYSSWSPYAYSLNNPVRFIDPDGAAPMDVNCPSCPTNEQFANALATDILSVKHSLYNLVARPFGYEATFVQNKRGNYETGFVETDDSFLAASAKYGLDALSVLTFGRGGGPNAFLAKTPGKAALTNQAKNLFNASDDLVASLADKIEGVAPGRVQNVERIIKGSDGRIKTDFDIELDNMVVEVTRGGGKGKASQVLNKIQPETSKNVVVFGPNLKPSVQKELTNQGVQFFTKEEDLMNFVNQ